MNDQTKILTNHRVFVLLEFFVAARQKFNRLFGGDLALGHQPLADGHEGLREFRGVDAVSPPSADSIGHPWIEGEWLFSLIDRDQIGLGEHFILREIIMGLL